MPYLDETGLAHYDPKLKEWISAQSVKTIPSSLYPWTLTEKAGAVTCWPVGGTQLLPVVDFMFTETPPANGDKSPENPSTISGVSSVKVTRCGKNLISTPYYHASGREIEGITYTLNPDGSLVCNGTAEGYSSFIYAYAKFLQVGTYTLSGCPSGGNASTTYSLAIQRSAGATYQDYGNGVTFEVQEPGFYYIAAFVKPGYVASNLVFSPPQLELGSAATTFEPYDGADYTINLGGTYYGGSIDLATGVMTVTHVAVTPDASTVDISSAPAAIPLDYADTYGRTITSADGTSLSVGSAGGTVVYKLATPYTVQLDPTQILSLTQTDKYTPRLNTLYTDASAVQVGYVKSPIREEIELQQAIVAQGGNI